MSVHAKGVIWFLDETGLEEVLQKTTLHFENYGHQSPTIFDNLPSAFKQKVMKTIVAFEIKVIEMDNIFKLSQDRDAESCHNNIDKRLATTIHVSSASYRLTRVAGLLCWPGRQAWEENKLYCFGDAFDNNNLVEFWKVQCRTFSFPVYLPSHTGISYCIFIKSRNYRLNCSY